MSMTYYKNNGTSSRFIMDSEEGAQSFLKVKPVFPWFDMVGYHGISSVCASSFMDEEVVTAYLPLLTSERIDPACVIGNRKFCLQSGTSFLRLYKPFRGEVPGWMPAEARILFIGENYEEFKRSYPAKASKFHELCFMGNEAAIESAFKLPVHRGTYETYYSVSVSNGQPVRVKQHVHDERSLFSDWDVLRLLHDKKPKA